ncbi:LacI family DNA-binding transcriptional regulator [Variovorax sp. dw_954]|uniref:LacI family DNA-binding transcriptional regulator n=1 Tax=Variovorax sp. dw_954 TaxID=2720078 RepID=UPI001BD47BDD|nr:LacI family DNA-binding transcriptional regulator [Variovorax sp. dw_954]
MPTRPSKPPYPKSKRGPTSVRLQDIADRLGLSQSTVSRALAGHSAISEATRASVQQAAADLGFRFGAGNRRSRKSTSRMIGLVVGNLHNSFMTLLLEELHKAFAEYGYHTTLIIDSLNEAEQLPTFRPLIDGYFEGMVFATATLDSQVVPEVQRRGIPLVLVVRSVDDVSVDTVEIDNFHAGAEAARHLHDLGHRRIGMVLGPQNTSTSRDRARGVLSVLNPSGKPQTALPVMWGLYTTEHGYSSALQLLAQPKPVTAIIAGNDTIALGVLEAAKQSRVAVPGGLSVIGFDDNPLSGSPLIGLTTVRQPVETMARTAARRLLERIGAKNINPVTRDVLPTQLIARRTTGSAR